MEKSDKSIHNICIFAIKRNTFKPYAYKWARFYEENIDFTNASPEIELELSNNELVICSTVIDKDNYGILTTQQLTTKERGILSSGDFNNATHKYYGDLRDHKNAPLTLGMIELGNGNPLKYFIETGKASMIIVHGVKTRLELEGMTSAQVEKLPKIWSRRDKRLTNNS